MAGAAGAAPLDHFIQRNGGTALTGRCDVTSVM
jgi:hypothetical protein